MGAAATTNAASFLIARPLRYERRHFGWPVVKAYSDPRFGEAGLVYRAVGFKACPPSKHGNKFRYGLASRGKVLSDRQLYRRFGSMPAARAAGAEIIRLPARTAWQRVWQ